MEFLKEVALPQSAGHYQLLLFVLNMVESHIILMTTHDDWSAGSWTPAS